MPQPNPSATNPSDTQSLWIPPAPHTAPSNAVANQGDFSTNRLTDIRPPSHGDGFLILQDLVIPLSKTRETLIGRSRSCNVVLSNLRVSKVHAAIHFSNGQFFLRDLDSANGTFINNRKVSDHAEGLVADDHVYLRPYRMMFTGAKHPHVASLLQTRAESHSKKQRIGHFCGKLEILLITDLIQLLNSTQQSGVLTIRDTFNHVAEVAFVGGEIRTARYKQLEGEDAIYGLLETEQGEFEFVQGSPPTVGPQIQTQTLSLLFQACQLLEDDTNE